VQQHEKFKRGCATLSGSVVERGQLRSPARL